MQPLRIAVAGVGSIGSTFAFYLARGGHEVTAVARPGSARLRQLQRDGGIVDSKGERAAVRVLDTLDDGAVYDLVIVTLLAHQVDAILPALRQGGAKWVQFMLNTFEPERLRDAMGADHCSFGMPFVQAKLGPDGELSAKVGSQGQRSKMNHRGWVQVFNAAGLPAVYEPNMLLWLRCHAPLCVAFESVCVAGMRRGGGAPPSESMRIAEGLQESLKLVQGLGYELYPRGKGFLRSSPIWVAGGMLWAMSRIRSFRELLATGEGECCALIDTIVRAAHETEFPVSIEKILAMKPSQK